MEARRDKNGGGGQSSRRPSTRVKELVNYDEKAHMAELEEDIAHGVAHAQKLAKAQPAALNELEERVLDLDNSWETESFIEEYLVTSAEEQFFTDGNVFSFSIARNGQQTNHSCSA